MSIPLQIKPIQVQGDGDATLLSVTHGNVALQTVPVYLMSGNRKLKVNALFRHENIYQC